MRGEARFTADLILDGAARLVARRGPAATTIRAIAAEIDGPSGSIYHRFASLDLLLARLWVRTVRRSQEGFVAALADPDLDAAAAAAALHVPRWSREHLDDARVLLLRRREDLVGRWPDELDAELAELNAPVATALTDHARRRYGRAGRTELDRVLFALVDLPYAAVRRHLLAGQPPPETVDALVVRAALAALDEEPRLGG